MATIYPEDPAYHDPESHAERVLYPLLAALPEHYTVFCNRRWHVRRAGAPAAAEADFLVAHPDRGVLVVEVKGGVVSYEPAKDRWLQNGEPLDPDPFKQVQRIRFLLRDLWRQCHGAQGELPLGEAVAFPDARVRERDFPVGLLPERVLDGDDLKELEGALVRAFEAFDLRDNEQSFGRRGMRLLTDLIAGSVQVRRHIGRQITAAQDEFIRLTENQYLVLNHLERHRRVCVVGGAGTGKTLLAIEEARRRASRGERVLITCYNAPLSAHIRSQVADAHGIQVFHYSLLCQTWAKRAGLNGDCPEGMDSRTYYDVHHNDLLSEATAALDERFDAILVDEAQDFLPDWLAALELLLRDENESPVYLFADENQAIYRHDFTWPDGYVHFPLVGNLRNTSQIHALLARHFGEKSIAQGPNGIDVQVHACWDKREVANQLSSILSNLTEHGVDPLAITVLSGRSRDSSSLARFQEEPLGKFRLSAKANGSNRIRFESIHRFKGLESPVVILCDMEELHRESRRSVWYTGLSRAQAGLVLLVHDRTGELEGVDADAVLERLLNDENAAAPR